MADGRTVRYLNVNDELAGPDAEIDAVERDEITEALDDAFQLDAHRGSLMGVVN